MIIKYDNFIAEHIKFEFKNDYQKNRYEPILSAVVSAKIGDVLPNEIIYLYVEYLTDISGKYDDSFIDGDLGDRLDWFTKYELKKIPLYKLSLDNWDTDEENIDVYKDKYLNTKEYPPIVVESDLTIRDGVHRANALSVAGEEYILAFVGKK